MARPIVAISLGDMAGIGPEIVAKLLARPETYVQCRPLVLGDPRALATAGRLIGHAFTIRQVRDPSEATGTTGVVDVFQPEGVCLGNAPMGMVSREMGEAAAQCLVAIARFARERLIAAAVLAPMNKQAFHLTGQTAIDELEYLAELTDSPEPFLLGAINQRLWTAAVTLHVPFADVAGLITPERIKIRIRQLAGALRAIGIAQPRIAVAALNPHAGDGGGLGRAEIDVIEPAMATIRDAGLTLIGPVPADTVFVRARRGEFDGVVCMYHDQANIARKLLATADGATIFMGLPVVMATTAHGTAFDIVGQGIADPGSLVAALADAILLSGSAAS